MDHYTVGHGDYLIEQPSEKKEEVCAKSMDFCEEWKRLYQDEQRTCKEIGGMFGFGATTVKRVLERSNVELRKRGKIPKKREFDEEWKKLYLDGFLLSEIANQYGVASSDVLSGLRRLGVPTR